MNDIIRLIQAFHICIAVALFLVNTGRALKAIEICKECLIILRTKAIGKGNQFGKMVYCAFYNIMFRACLVISDNKNAVKYGIKLLVIYRECGETALEGNVTIELASLYKRRCEYAEARELYERAIKMMIESGDRRGEATSYGKLGTVFYALGDYHKAKEYLEKALSISIEIGDRQGEAADYGNLGAVFQSLGEYDKAKEYYEKALAMTIEIGHRAGEATSYGNLGTVFHSLGGYFKAKEYLEKSLAIKIEIGDRKGEATDYANLGAVFRSLGEYDKAKKYHEDALAMTIEIGDRAGEATNYAYLGTVFQSLGEYDKAKEYHEKALAIRSEIGNRAGEAENYGNLGTVYKSLGEYDKAKEYYEKALAIRIKSGVRLGEASCYANLGTLFRTFGEYDKAKKYLEKALAITIEIGVRKEEAISYENLGTLFRTLGEYNKAKGFYEKALAIRIEIGDREGEASCYTNLGTVFYSLGENYKAKEYLENSLVITTEIVDRAGEASCYTILGAVFRSLGKYDKAKEYLEKALAIKTEFAGDREEVAGCYRELGILFFFLGEYVLAEGYLSRALLISQDIGSAYEEFACYCNLTLVKLSQELIQEAFHYLLQSINKSEELRSFLKDNDQFKISFLEVHDFPYKYLSAFFCLSGNPNKALYVLELARARSLADLMATQYCVERQISANPQSWIGIENIMKNESNCVCLYISYFDQDVFLWILKTSGVIYFRKIKVNEDIVGFGLVGRLTDFFARSFRSFSVLPKENCEDRSFNVIEPTLKSYQEESLAALRLVEDDDEEIQNSESSVSLCYRMLIAPVADLLDEPEIIIVPDRSLNQVPFAALRNKEGNYFSETFRIRIVSSLSTLKLIQDSQADYHSQTGALIIGDPVVGRVRYKGCRKTFNPLPCARKEAEMIGRLLDVKPLLGEHATKQAVLQAIHSVSLIHFAAHGNAERGEIALSPLCNATGIPNEEDYLLTMSDISQVGLRAKLVVLSCCHSGCGQIRAEGVIGIARAFLGSGARSVLVALWALDDLATEQFMRRFYKHLVRGDSASESLHEAMKWMRGNGFTKVSEWAPFMLIGDNVTFKFGK